MSVDDECMYLCMYPRTHVMRCGQKINSSPIFDCRGEYQEGKPPGRNYNLMGIKIKIGSAEVVVGVIFELTVNFAPFGATTVSTEPGPALPGMTTYMDRVSTATGLATTST